MNYIIRKTQWFIDNRPEIFKFVSKLNQNKKHISVKAPVKSGKRFICILYALLNQTHKHFYLSALDRIDDRVQLDELNAYGIKTFLSKDIDDLVKDVVVAASDYDEVVVHLNESDYGTGNRQKMSEGIKQLVSIPNVRLILYSATNEEAEYSKFIGSAAVEEFIPPSTYHGYEWFLNQGLVQNATDFWDLENEALTDQGVECCEILKSSNKIFGVIRFTNQSKIKNSKFEKSIRDDYGFSVRWISAKKGEEYNWGRGFYEDVGIRDYENSNHKVLLVICQTANRSTEIGFHEHIAFWHDSERGRGTAYNTIIQAAGRVIHYDKGPMKPVSIIVYSDVEEWKRAAGQPNDSKRKGSLRMSVDKKSNKVYIREIIDRPLTISEYNALARKYNGREFPDIQHPKVSTNTVKDLVKSALQAKPTANSAQETHASVIHLDSYLPNSKNSWDRYVVPQNLQGKFVALILVESIDKSRKDFTTTKSMYEHM